nr:transcription factor MYC2-like [Ipomoea batatas]
MVPNVSKMDKASILEDAIAYINQLESKLQKPPTSPHHNIEDAAGDEEDADDQGADVDVKIIGEDAMIKIECNKKNHPAARLMAALKELDLHIRHANVSVANKLMIQQATVKMGSRHYTSDQLRSALERKIKMDMDKGWNCVIVEMDPEAVIKAIHMDSDLDNVCSTLIAYCRSLIVAYYKLPSARKTRLAPPLHQRFNYGGAFPCPQGAGPFPAPAANCHQLTITRANRPPVVAVGARMDFHGEISAAGTDDPGTILNDSNFRVTRLQSKPLLDSPRLGEIGFLARLTRSNREKRLSVDSNTWSASFAKGVVGRLGSTANGWRVAEGRDAGEMRNDREGGGKTTTVCFSLLLASGGVDSVPGGGGAVVGRRGKGQRRSKKGGRQRERRTGNEEADHVQAERQRRERMYQRFYIQEQSPIHNIEDANRRREDAGRIRRNVETVKIHWRRRNDKDRMYTRRIPRPARLMAGASGVGLHIRQQMCRVATNKIDRSPGHL